MNQRLKILGSFLLLCAALAVPKTVGATWSWGGYCGKFSHSSSVDPWTGFFSTATIPPNSVGFLATAVDNDGDGVQTNDIVKTTTTDAGGEQIWNVDGEAEADPSSGAAGAVVSVSWKHFTSTMSLQAGATFFQDFGSAKIAKGGVCFWMNVAPGTGSDVIISSAGTIVRSTTTGDALPIQMTGLPLGDYLFLAFTASESTSAAAAVSSPGWVSVSTAGYNSGTNSSSMGIGGEYLIATSTTQSTVSDPTMQVITSIDRASSMIALQETVVVLSSPTLSTATWTGTLVEGDTVTVTLANGGGTGPTIVMFDNFESGVVGSSISTVANSATYLNWTGLTSSTCGPRYSDVEKYSGSKSMYNDMGIGTNGGEFYAYVDFSSATEIMVCNDWKITGDWPGYCGTGANMKMNWVQFGHSTTDTDLYRGFSASGCTIPTGSVYDGNDQSFTKSFTINIASTSAAAGSAEGWHSTCEYIRGTAPGTIRFEETKIADGLFRVGYSTTNLAVPFFDDAGNQHTYWTTVHIPGYGRVHPGTAWYHDNVYVATGTAGTAQARVYVMDTATFTASAVRAMGRVVSWSDSSIQFIFHQSRLSTNGTGYLFVCNSAGLCNDTGMQITLGDGVVTPPVETSTTTYQPDFGVGNSFKIKGKNIPAWGTKPVLRSWGTQ